MPIRLFAALFILLALVASPLASAQAQGGDFAAAVEALDVRSFNDKGVAIDALAEFDHPMVVTILQAMKDGYLFKVKDTGVIVVGEKSGNDYALTEAATGEAAGVAPSSAMKKIIANNKLRVQINAILGRLMLYSKNPDDRISAAKELMSSPSKAALDKLRQVMAKENDTAVLGVMKQAEAMLILFAGEKDEKLGAIKALEGETNPEIKVMLQKVAGETDDAEIKAAAEKAVAAIDSKLAALEVAQNLVFGLSYGSVLLLAAIGLAITFGVMGVINMAHGEMMMLGAYTTFAVQELFRSAFPPELFGLYLVVAIPAAFLVAGAMGVLMERSVIRFLYGRPLETLLATWGISLALQQLVRSIFGATNREVANPDWMAGSIELIGGLSLTTNRVIIIVFGFAVLAALAAAMRYTSFGLNMRAVTQNRKMASAMGIPTGKLDALTFGLGSGIAGVAGVALSQITNVSPNLGQGYIVDSFMVVVFGGVGSLWGTLVAAMSLGVFNKFLEPVSGAMLAKILILVFIILFIQKRPRGLFALKGRFVES